VRQIENEVPEQSARGGLAASLPPSPAPGLVRLGIGVVFEHIPLRCRSLQLTQPLFLELTQHQPIFHHTAGQECTNQLEEFLIVDPLGNARKLTVGISGDMKLVRS